MLENINNHAKYIGSTVGFVSDQIQDDISILTEAKVPTLVNYLFLPLII